VRRIRLLLMLGVAFFGTACSGEVAQLDVDLTEWAVRPSTTTVAPGRVRVVVHNRSAAGMVHELEVLAVRPDGQKDPIDEVEDVAPGASKSFTVKLQPGTYELACLIAAGESGSPVDHYQAGMHATLTVR
jgi:uncharacterized cupredoxin-like copper-binding protein